MSERTVELQDRFSDAAMELLMDRYALEEGELLLQRYQAAEEAVDPSLDKLCRTTIHNAYSCTRISSTLKRAAQAAACLFLIGILSFPLAMQVEAFRIPVLNFIIKQEKNYTSIQFTQDSHSFAAIDRLQSLIQTAVPDGYRLEYEKVNTDKHMGTETATSLLQRFGNGHDSVLDITVWKAGGTNNIDSQDAQVITLDLSGQEAVLVSKEGENRILWVNVEQGQLYSVTGYDVDPDTFWSFVYALSEATQTARHDIRF